MGAEYTRVYEESLVSSTADDRVRLQILRTPSARRARDLRTTHSTTLYSTVPVTVLYLSNSVRNADIQVNQARLVYRHTQCPTDRLPE